jgi:hypothetical protein
MWLVFRGRHHKSSPKTLCLKVLVAIHYLSFKKSAFYCHQVTKTQRNTKKIIFAVAQINNKFIFLSNSICFCFTGRTLLCEVSIFLNVALNTRIIGINRLNPLPNICKLSVFFLFFVSINQNSIRIII